jgi:anti-sigma-K factor RskA
LLAAAALGVLIGLGGALIGTRWLAPSPTVLTEVALEALPGHTGRGTAQLLRDGQQILLEVHVESAVPAGDYLELWLLDRGQTRMYPLGVLPSDGVGTYPVPPFLGDSLDGFTIVDVSLEPDDGDPAHSSDSVVRGTLPM